MPLPLKPGYNFNFDRRIHPPHFEMAAAEAYTDFYGVSTFLLLICRKYLLTICTHLFLPLS